MTEQADSQSASAYSGYPSKDYISALSAYWEWQPRRCIERLTTALSLGTCPGEEFRLFRLWIEVLAQLGDVKSLKNLREHFSYHVSHIPESANTLAALKGLAHFELDEIEAAELVLKTIAKDRSNPYVWELSHRLEARRKENPIPSGFKKHRNKLNDYFQLIHYAHTALRNEDRSELSYVYNRLSQLFPKTPFLDLVEFHGFLDQGLYAKAINPARRLVERFPLNRDFAFGLGYALAKFGEYESAINAFTQMESLGEDDDPDALAWLGYSYARSAILEKSQALKVEAEKVLKRAVAVAEDMGISATFPAREMAMLQEEFAQGHGGGPKRVWLLKVDAIEFHRFRTGSVEEIAFMECSIHPNAQPGDYCFIFGDDHNENQRRWRFGALFKVVSQPYFHPQFRFMNQLMLVDRPEMSVPIEVHELGNDKRTRVSFELDGGAVANIASTISEYLPESAGVYSREFCA